MKCNLCPNNCLVDRDFNEGLCHADNTMRVCRIAPHYYEEPIISGTNGSGTVFFSGCSMDCVFCQNHEISKRKVGRPYTPRQMADEFKKLEESGVHNINLVTPTHFSHKIREALDIYRPSIPIVYNTSGYEKPEIIEEMNAYVDVYLTDMKYCDNETAMRYSGRKNYFDYCKKSCDVMIESKPLIEKDGLLKQGVIVRHLILPTEINNTLGVIRTFMADYMDKAYLSVMSQFIPSYNSPIKRTLKPVEVKIVLNELYKYDTDKCFVQELSSASDDFVPKFEV